MVSVMRLSVRIELEGFLEILITIRHESID